MILMLCCNDYRNGNFSGELDCLEWDYKGTAMLKLIADRRVGLNYDLANKRVKISRRWFPIRGHRSWYGNWCWDGIDVHPKTALAILNYVQPMFHCEEGEVSLYDLWDEHKPISLDALKKAAA